MNTARVITAAVVASSLAMAGCRLLPTPTTPVAADRQQSDGQLVIHSDFALPHDHRLLREIVAERLAVAEQLDLPPCDEPIHVHLFRDGDTFSEFMRAHFPSMPNRRAFFVETDTRLMVYAHWSDQVAEDLRHEVAHGYLHASVGNLPLWLDEGLAEYFEVPRARGGLNQPHVDLLIDLMEHNDWRPDLKRLAALDDFSAMTQQDYAEAWAWIHFLLESEPARRELLQTHLAKLRRDGVAEPLERRLAKLHVEPERNLVEHLLALAEER